MSVHLFFVNIFFHIDTFFRGPFYYFLECLKVPVR